MNPFPLEIVTPDGIAFSGEVESLLVRTDNGDIEFLKGHEDYFAPLGIGRARILAGGESRYASSAGGFVSVSGGRITVCATTFEFTEEIDLNRARKAKERAEAMLAKANDEKALNNARAKLYRAINRINVKESFK